LKARAFSIVSPWANVITLFTAVSYKIS
jgi:hypothetical protein